MSNAAFLPSLSTFDIERAVQLIQQAYASSQVSTDEQRRLQHELFDIQKHPQAWGLVIPFLENTDPNVQFFGAHTAQVKIARDWEVFPQDHVLKLRDLLLDLTAHSVVAGHSKVVLRKLFVALTSLALKLAPTRPTQWADWIMGCVSYLSGRGAGTGSILDFLSIVAEEVESADLIGSPKMEMQQSLSDAVPMVVKAVSTSISAPPHVRSPQELQSALKCLEAWSSILPGNDLTPLLPLLIALLTPPPESLPDEEVFIPASDALQEIMSKSALSSGSGTKTLTEPLLIWCEQWGGRIITATLSTGSVDPVSHSFCKLLASLGDHSTGYLASNIASAVQVVPVPTHVSSTVSPPVTKSHLVQTFLKLLLSYTGLPGFYGIDEDESEMTLGFWYLFQEALWSADYYFEDGDGSGFEEQDNDQWIISKAVYGELVSILRRKVVFPQRAEQRRWAKDQEAVFQVYRRDVGDTLINAFYVLRDDMLGFYINDIVQRLSTMQDHQGWEEIEATLHCVMSIQEAIPLEDNVHLSRLFSSDILGRMPTAGDDRVRRTTLGLIGAYASWFTTQASTTPTFAPSLLMNSISYVVTALPEQSLCLQAANALRDLCDANRMALAPHIGAFAELHAGLTDIPDTEKSKVLQSIASVIQALPPQEEIPPIEAIVGPVVQKLVDSLNSFAHLPEEARTVVILQLQTLTGVAKGLTRTADSLLVLDESPAEQAESECLLLAREDMRMVKLREALFSAIRTTVELWCTDASVSDALSDLIKSITSLPSDTTLLSLPAGPLLELVCLASQRHLTAVWLSLANMLIIQLDPPSLLPLALKTEPNSEAHGIISRLFPVLLQTSLSSLAQPGAMEANPDVVQAFFGCMDTMALHFVGAFYNLPAGILDALMHCAISSLALQERYSLVSACTFIATLINRTSSDDKLGDAKTALINAHGRMILQALLHGFAGVAPRSATLNLIELLSTMVSRCFPECKVWMGEILFADDFVPSKANLEAKEKFVKAVLSSRSIKRTRDAAQQFTLVARGLEGSSFGYASVSM